MPKTEHTAPSAKELREELLKCAEYVDLEGETIWATDLRRLASGPTLEERIAEVGKHDLEEAFREGYSSGEADADARANLWDEGPGVDEEVKIFLREFYARKLSEEAGG